MIQVDLFPNLMNINAQLFDLSRRQTDKQPNHSQNGRKAVTEKNSLISWEIKQCFVTSQQEIFTG